ncbi:alpha/beta hydrolase [Massilia sp. KIM]|uniref:alpha/beta fold hydrolase n=1 Tax=Massilia sp. KIM TaxID=1955422 RepID=UPI0009CC008D|nr:alpha/beta fold hydrolase [Massilia sp. KIM]OON62766.1 alpha/beta hydrolase [Massilia sp. KIM]
MYATSWNYLNTLGAQALKNMDRSRQARGKMLERAGYGPQQTPSTVLHSETGLNVRRYEGAQPDGPAVLLVPAPIKRSYIWDLAPQVSVVQRWLQRGYQVYLAEWVPVPEDKDHFGLDDYGHYLLGVCREVMAQDSGQRQAVIAGHSLGGILAAIYSAMHPEHLRATVLLESPLHVDPESCCFHKLIRQVPHARAIAETYRQVPGMFLNMMSAMAEPQAFQLERMVDRFLSMANPQALANHMRVERWSHDEFPLPGRLFTEIVEDLYRKDAFMRGALDIDGRKIGPADLRQPLACVADPRSKVIPLDAMVAFHDAAGSARKLLLHYEGDVGVNLQHVGVLVGHSAHARIWPAIFDWLDREARP